MREIWRPINNHEEYYEVSNLGNIRSTITGRILRGDRNSSGYRRVILYRPFKERVFVHRIVALHFCENYRNDLVVNHKDGNKSNNSCDNLEWVTRSENDKHAFRIHLRTPNTKPKYDIYAFKNGKLVNTYESAKACGDDLGVSTTCIYACCNKRQKTCKGYVLRKTRKQIN